MASTEQPASTAPVEEPVSPVKISETAGAMETVEITDTRTTPRALTPIPEADTASECPNVAFHPDADLEVIIPTPNDNPTTYMVCASALACASTIWRTMIYHDAAYIRSANDDTKQDRSQAMKLSGHPEAIGLLFQIIHYDFKHVPTEPTLNELFELCKSACQYKCAHILYPWAGQWSASLSNFVAEVDCYAECHKALQCVFFSSPLSLSSRASSTTLIQDS